MKSEPQSQSPQMNESQQPQPQITPRTKRRIASVASDHSYSSTKSKDRKGSSTKTARQTTNKSNVSHESEQKPPDMTTDQQQQQQKQEPEQHHTTYGTPEKVLDLVKRDDSGDVKCLVKYKGEPEAKWILADEIRYTHPLLLINYYETRIILRKTQCDMAFDSAPDSAPENRKLIVITSK